jgi:hypothetical protein
MSFFPDMMLMVILLMRAGGRAAEYYCFDVQGVCKRSEMLGREIKRFFMEL